MADQFVLAHIKNLPIFQKLPPEQLEQVAEAVEVFQVAPNARIFREGQTLPGMYLIVQGRAFLMQTGANGGEQKVGEVVPYQYLGEAALFNPVVESRSLWVIERVVLLFIGRDRFLQVLAEHPQLKVNLESKYAAFPEATKPLFKGQRPGEKVVLIQLRHPWSIIRNSLLPILLGLIIIFVGYMLSGNLISLVIMGLGVLIPVAWFIYTYTEWRDDAVIITDQRVLKVENILWKFESNISEVPLISVHEVNTRIPPGDLMARYLGYGTVEIKTAGTSGNLTLDYIPKPDRIQRILLTDKDLYHHAAKQRHRDAIRTEIDRFLTPDQVVEQEKAKNTPVSATNTNTQRHLLSTRFINAQGDLIIRRHLSVWLGHIFLPVLAFLGGVLLTALGVFSIPLGALGTVETIFGLFVMLLGGIWLYWADWDWRNDMMILGANTITLIHKRPLFLQNISDKMLLSQVDSVISDKHGFFNTLLDRGDVRISLVGDDKGKLFSKVHQPDEVQAAVSNQRASVLSRSKEEELRRQRQEIAEYIDVYHERMRE
ncbi:MAG: cyclic nucleotide-binding domain-containing protein, partial [Anaerolineae bacterium]|nr:cyclic nucleotide-binding domain-containing protein [Anaerolineae bacterium]